MPNAFHETFHHDALKGRCAIVTGAGAKGDGIGIGRASAIILARAGAKVVLVDIALERAEQTAEMIEAEAGDCIALSGDVSASDDCKRIVAAAVDYAGGVNILVNNVGIRGAVGTAVDTNLDAWNAGLNVNVTSIMLMSKYCIPEMIRIGGGSIVNMSSVAGFRGGHPYLLYPTTKGAIIAMTQSMAVHHGRDQIRVNCVCPGMIYTPLVAETGMSDARREARKNASLLKTEGTAWDIASSVLFLVSDASRWITGHILPVDAGLTATSPIVPSIEDGLAELAKV